MEAHIFLGKCAGSDTGEILYIINFVTFSFCDVHYREEDRIYTDYSSYWKVDANEIKLNWHVHFAVKQSLRKDFSIQQYSTSLYIEMYMVGGFSILKLFERKIKKFEVTRPFQISNILYD